MPIKSDKNWYSKAIKNKWSWLIGIAGQDIPGQVICGWEPANGSEIRIMPKYGQKNLLMLETRKLAWELWFAIRLHNFYFKALSQSKGSYQVLMKFMLLKSQLSSKTSGEVENFPADILDNFFVPLRPVFF